jgi:hypothetical protein
MATSAHGQHCSSSWHDVVWAQNQPLLHGVPTCGSFTRIEKVRMP